MGSRSFFAICFSLFFSLAGCGGEPDNNPPFLSKMSGHVLDQTFEGHYPCMGQEKVAGCQRLKVALALFKNQKTGNPSRYRFGFIMVGVDNTRHMWEGNWRQNPDTGFAAKSLGLTLEGNLPMAYRHHVLLDDHTLLLLRVENKKIRRGNASETFTLTKTNPQKYQSKN